MTKEEALKALDELGYNVELTERKLGPLTEDELVKALYDCPEPGSFLSVVKAHDARMNECYGPRIRRVAVGDCLEGRPYFEQWGGKFAIARSDTFDPATAHVYELPEEL